MTNSTSKTFAPPFDAWLDRDEPTDTHAAISARLRTRADGTLKEGERVVSSEELYGSAAHAVKKIARRRGWPHHSHEALRTIVGYLGKQAEGNVVDARYVGALFSDLESLHRNFYNDNLSAEQIDEGQETLRRFLLLLTQADKQVPAATQPPTDPRYREVAMAYLRKFHRRAPRARRG